MKKFEKYLKSAMREKAPDNWDKIEAAAKENMPQKESKKRNFKFIYSPASLMICAAIVVAAIAVVPNLDRIFNPVPTTASSESTSYESTDSGTTSDHGIADTTTEATIPTTEGTTIATTTETTIATKITTTDGTMIETTDTTAIETIITTTTGIPAYAHEKREATFENEYGSYSVKYNYFTASAVYGKIEITEITVISGSEFMLEPAFMLEGRSIDLPAEIFIENKTGAPLKKFIFADGIKSVFAEVSNGAESIYVPASLENIAPSHMSSGVSVFFAENLGRIDVSGENNVYASENGVLFSKDKNTLIRFPAAHAEKNYIIPSGTSEISADAFVGAELESLTVPASVSSINLECLHIGKLYLESPNTDVIRGDDATVDMIITKK